MRTCRLVSRSGRLAGDVALLDLLTGSPGGRMYVHCEAGKGRTGVATACYRMAVMGWSAADALIEAKNFGCSVPRQQAFIEAFGVMPPPGPTQRDAKARPR